MVGSFGEFHDPVLWEEIELLGRLIEAVAIAGGPLDGAELDTVLGLPSRDATTSEAPNHHQPSTA